MRCIISILLAAFFVGPAWATPDAPQASHPSKAGMQELVESSGPLRAKQVATAITYLLANGKAYFQDELEPYLGVHEWMYTVTVDDASAKAVAEAIGKIRGRSEPLYVANELLIPFRHSDSRMPSREAAATLAKALDPLARRGRFRQIPTLNEKAMEQLAMPSGEAASKAPARLLLQAVASVQKRRDEKYRREYPVIANNQLLWDLQKSLWRLKVIAATDNEVKQIAGEAIRLEREGNGMFIHVMQAVGDAASQGRLSPEDAQGYWDAFMPRYASLPSRSQQEEQWKKLASITGYLVNYKPDQQSTYGHDSPFIERRHAYFSMLNELAKILDKPAPPKKD